MKLTSTTEANAYAKDKVLRDTIATRPGENLAANTVLYGSCESDPVVVDGSNFWFISYKTADTDETVKTHAFPVYNYLAEDGELLTIFNPSTGAEDELRQKIRKAYNTVKSFRKAAGDPSRRVGLERIIAQGSVREATHTVYYVRLSAGSGSRDFVFDVMGNDFEDVQGDEDFKQLVDPDRDDAKAIIEAVRAFAKAYVAPPPLAVSSFESLE